MPDHETAAVHPPATVETDQWVEDSYEELPPRPRRRLLAPAPLALLGVLLIACGFIGGVLVEKGQTSSSSTGAGGAAGLASRFAALRGASGVSSGVGTGAGAAGRGSGAAGGFVASGSGASGSATIGQVAYIDGSTLYVTNAEGNTVKVKTSQASTVTKTVKAEVKSIRPGETVVITGATGAKGEVSAESIRVGGAGGGLGALFGGSGRGAGGGGGGGGGTRGSGGSPGGEPALFGKGG
jgi:hypothetical protein